MKMNLYMRIKEYARVAMAGLLICSGLAGCNDTMEDSLKYGYPSPPKYTGQKTGHVLLVVMDGVSGTSMMAARNAGKAMNISDMQSNSLYTDYGLGDISDQGVLDEEKGLTQERGWANLLVGNSSHKVKTSSDLTINEIHSNLLSYVADAGSDVSLYVSEQSIKDAFAPQKCVAEVLNNDEDVEEALLNVLRQPVTSKLIVAQLHGVVEAVEAENGKFYGEQNVPTATVLNAVETIDERIGRIRKTLMERPEYEKENWLVILTSSYGGLFSSEEDLDSYYLDLNRNIFTLMYNERFVSQVQGFPGNQSLSYSYYTPAYSYLMNDLNPVKYAESARVDDTTLGDLEFTEVAHTSTVKKWLLKPMTIQFFVKSDKASPSKACFLSKTSYSQENGWCIGYIGGQQFLFSMGSWTAGTFAKRKIDDWSKWHVFTLRWKPVDDSQQKPKTRISIFVDGVEVTYKELLNLDIKNKYHYREERYIYGDVSKVPLRIGGTDLRVNANGSVQVVGTDGKKYTCKEHWDWGSCKSNNSNFYVTNLQIYNVALPDEDIKKYAGMDRLHLRKESYPYWGNLEGYWPCDLEEDEGNVYLKNYADPIKLEDDMEELQDNEADDNAVDHSRDFVIDRGSANVWVAGNDESSEALKPYRDPNLFYAKTVKSTDITRQILLWLGHPIAFDWDLEGLAWQFIYRDMQDESN